MQRGGGGDYRETEAVPGEAAALIETVEAFDDAGSLRWRNAGTVVLNDHRDGIPILGRPNAHGCSAAGVFQGVIDQVHERARNEILVAEGDRLTLDLTDKRDSFSLRGGVVELDDIVDDNGERHRRERLTMSPGLGLRDLQQPVEHPDQLVDFLNG